MEELWNLCRGFMEKILDWNMEKPWSICGDLTRWKIIGWKISKRAKIEWYAKQTGKVKKCFGKLQTGQALKAARRF
jgi:hypothetical protein